jgi:single-strand DNA-binding protein
MAARNKTKKDKPSQPESVADAQAPKAPPAQTQDRRNGSLGVNKVILIGNLGHDPNLRYTQGGTPVTTLRIATSLGFRDAQGKLERRTEWHRVVAWNRLAEVAVQYLVKGRPVYIEGRLQTREWSHSQSGERRFTTEIVAQQLRLVGGRPETTGVGQPPPDVGSDIPF